MKAGIYVHLPFCGTICPYCDFAVTTGSLQRRARFVEALLAEIEIVASLEPEAAVSEVGTIYLGGGTPTALTDGQIGSILSSLRSRFCVAAEARVTMEANPEDVTGERAAAWRALGVGTLSLGVQSLDARALRFLGRRHTAEEAAAAVEVARGAGFATVSVDLMFGLPGQATADLQREIEHATELRPDHVSCYQLTFHDGTPFGKRLRAGRIEELPDERQLELFQLAHRALTDNGFDHYEVSNYAADESHRSRHNLKYWKHVPYRGLGPSAHSYDGDRTRSWNLADTEEYRSAVAAGERPTAGAEHLTDEALLLEHVMLGLRTAAGIDLDHLERRFGLDLVAANTIRLDAAIADGLVRIERRRLVPEARGMALADHLARELDLSAGRA